MEKAPLNNTKETDRISDNGCHWVCFGRRYTPITFE